MKNELNVAINAAKEAGKIILKYYKSDFTIKEKGFGNPVTTADIAADDYLKKTLTNYFPEYGWLSEETVDAMDRLSKSRIWIVDPIDGTKEFIHGTDEFVVSIGLVENGSPVLGVIYNPVKEEIFYSSKGEGSYLNDLQIFCNEYKSSKDMVLLISGSERKKGLWNRHRKKFKSLNNTKSKMLLQIHDELIFEVPNIEKKNICNIIKEEMASVSESDLHAFSIPLTVDVNVGDNWGILH